MWLGSIFSLFFTLLAWTVITFESLHSKKQKNPENHHKDLWGLGSFLWVHLSTDAIPCNIDNKKLRHISWSNQACYQSWNNNFLKSEIIILKMYSWWPFKAYSLNFFYQIRKEPNILCLRLQQNILQYNAS